MKTRANFKGSNFKHNLTNDDLYILQSYKAMKAAGVTYYTIWKASQYTKYPICESTAKRLYKEESLPRDRDVYMGMLTTIYNVMKTVKTSSKKRDVLKKTIEKLKEKEDKEKVKDGI